MSFNTTYIVFALVILAALVFDLVLLSRKNTVTSIKKALLQTLFWIGLAAVFGVYIFLSNGTELGIQYVSAYLMEWSLSIDNIFVFIIIFSAFKIKEERVGRVLLIGIIMAIVLRILFITIGVAVVQKVDWILYLFGVFLVYTGYKMFAATEEDEFNPKESKAFKFLQKFFPVVLADIDGRYLVKQNGKPVYTVLFVVVVMLAVTDIAFALDSIPAVLGISTEKLIIYSSNSFAVLGLRSLFFLLKKAVTKFDYLPQGIAIILVFIGIKMLGEHFINPYLSKNTLTIISLAVIVVCLAGSVFYSIYHNKKVANRVEKQSRVIQ